MAMSERTRSKFHQGLRGMMDDDEEAIGEVLSNFPARDVEEPATKELVQTEVAVLRVDIAHSESRLRGEIGSVRSELKADIADLRTEFKADIAKLDTDIAHSESRLRGEIGSVRSALKADIAGLRTELKGDITELRTDLKGDITELRTDLKGDIAGIVVGTAELRTEFKDEVHSALRWTIATMLTLATLIVAVSMVW